MTAEPEFQQFQRDFGLHLRNPRAVARPDGVPARRARAYRELLFNNVCGVVDACFPVCRGVLGERRWGRLQRSFFAEWRSQSPLFCDLPREFLRWLNQTEIPVAMPAWMPELLHYEWAELAVDIMQTAPLPAIDAGGDLLAGRPVVAPAHMALAYAWPVHRIGQQWQPRSAEDATQTCLLLFRNVNDEIVFLESTAVVFRLLQQLDAGENTVEQALAAVAVECGMPANAVFEAQGLAALRDLLQRGMLFQT